MKPACRAPVQPFVRPAFVLLDIFIPISFFPLHTALCLWPPLLLILLGCLLMHRCWLAFYRRFILLTVAGSHKHSFALSLVQPRPPVRAKPDGERQTSLQDRKHYQASKSARVNDEQATGQAEGRNNEEEVGLKNWLASRTLILHHADARV